MGSKSLFNFLSVAKSSATEVRSQLYRASDRNHISETEFQALYNEADILENMIGGLMAYLKNLDIKGIKYKLKS
ncbi:MAG TPA: four helix bundle protein [Chryseosolibacter sp.]